MSDYISREAAIEQFRKELDGGYVLDNASQTTRILKSIPAVDVIETPELPHDIVTDFLDCRNELCFRCGEYKRRHEGACNGCRWLH